MYLPKPTKELINKLDLSKAKHRGPAEMKWYVYRRGFYDMKFFVNYFLSHYLVDSHGVPIGIKDFHQEFMQHMKNTENVVIIFPRNHGKTTNIIFTTIHDICYGQEKGILFIMQKILGEKTVNKIRVEFESNQRIIEIFGRLVPQRTKAEQNKTWRADYLAFLNGVDLQVISKEGTIRGARKTKCYTDDPEEDKDVKTMTNIEGLRDRIAGTIIPMFAQGNLKITGTVIHDDCLVNHIYRNATTFKKISMEAISNPEYEEIGDNYVLVGGEPIRPERMSIEVLNKLLQDMQSVSNNGFDIWKREFLHIPFNNRGERIRKAKEIARLQVPKRYSDDIFDDLRIYGKPKLCMIGVDTAGGKANGDYSVISVRALDGKLLAFRYAKGGPDVIIDVLDRVFELGYTGMCAIEVNNETGGTTITLAQQKRRVNYLYRREDIDSYTGKKQKKYGRRTDVKSRATALGEYDVSVRGGKGDEIPQLIEFDERCIAEMGTFIRDDESGKREAQANCHDDAIMGDAICWQMRKEQQYVEIY